MIKKTKSGYIVTSEKGKKLGGPYTTRENAERRLRQIEISSIRRKKNNEMNLENKTRVFFCLLILHCL